MIRLLVDNIIENLKPDRLGDIHKEALRNAQQNQAHLLSNKPTPMVENTQGDQNLYENSAPESNRTTSGADLP